MIIAAAVVPLLVCLLLSGVRDSIENTNAALLLVLVVVGVAALGSRAAGLVAAVSGAACFDYFLTAPYDQFRIGDRSDIETTVLLLLIGAAVTELALWGRRQQARASEQRGYLDGILQTTAVLADAAPAATVITHVEGQLVELLDLDTATYVARLEASRPILHPDEFAHPGTADPRRRSRRLCRPTPRPSCPYATAKQRIEVPSDWSPPRTVRRPTVQQRRLAALLADRVAFGSDLEGEQLMAPVSVLLLLAVGALIAYQPGSGRDGSDDGDQHRGQLRHQHQLAVVRGGVDASADTAQAVGLTVQNFTSAAVGIAVAAALLRGFAARNSSELGNFWVDLIRIVLRLLLPLSIVVAVLLLACGVIQNLDSDRVITTIAGGSQTLPGGPVASQEAIKLLGTNGGGFFNANSAHPYENHSPVANLIEIAGLLIIPVCLTRTAGTKLGRRRQGTALLAAMVVLWGAVLAATTWAEVAARGSVPAAAGAAMEGKETQFGIWGSALFATSTAGTSTGAVNGMQDSMTAARGGLTLINMLLGEVSPGGVGLGRCTGS